MSLVVLTAKLGTTEDPEALIISRKFNEKVVLDGHPGGHRGVGLYLSPSASLQSARWKRCGYKLENETEEEWELYCKQYKNDLRASYRAHRKAWDELLSWERVVIVSRGDNPRRDARVVLASEVLVKLGATYLGELG